MAAVTIRNLCAETHRALKHRAKLNGRITEAEIRSILDGAALPEGRIRIGSELAAFGRRMREMGFELNVERSSEPIEAAEFE